MDIFLESADDVAGRAVLAHYVPAGCIALAAGLAGITFFAGTADLCCSFPDELSKVACAWAGRDVNTKQRRDEVMNTNLKSPPRKLYSSRSSPQAITLAEAFSYPEARFSPYGPPWLNNQRQTPQEHVPENTYTMPKLTVPAPVERILGQRVVPLQPGRIVLFAIRIRGIEDSASKRRVLCVLDRRLLRGRGGRKEEGNEGEGEKKRC